VELFSGTEEVEIMPSLRIRMSLGLLAGGCTVLLTAAGWAASQGRPTVQTPRQVADTLDRIVQPRFQANAGRFGIDRVIIAGHDNIYDLDITTRADRSRLRLIKQARHPFVMAFLHCVHKPGQNVGAEHPEPLDTNFTPYVDILASGTKTQSGNDRLDDWGRTHLAQLTVPHLAQLKAGSVVDAENGNWVIAMRPVRAQHSACLGCHAGAKRGDTLGVMVYAVDKNVNQDPLKSIQAAGI
jgi:hypothetical protein